MADLYREYDVQGRSVVNPFDHGLLVSGSLEYGSYVEYDGRARELQMQYTMSGCVPLFGMPGDMHRILTGLTS